MKILSIDFGLVRIGTAVGTTESGIAFAREVYVNDKGLFEELNKLFVQEEFDKVLVGLPIQRDGELGDIGDKLMDFVDELKQRFAVPVEMFDERYSSKIAQDKLKELGLNAKEQRGELDSMAAQVILQDYLDRN